MKTMDEITRARLRKESEKQLAESIAHAQVAPARFLEAWLKGVKIVGEAFFEFRAPPLGPAIQPARSLRDVTNKWQVSPRWAFIEESIGVLSGGEGALLAVMCSFYNAEWGGGLMRDRGIEGMADISGKLDQESIEIVAALLMNYTGW